MNRGSNACANKVIQSSHKETPIYTGQMKKREWQALLLRGCEGFSKFLVRNMH